MNQTIELPWGKWTHESSLKLAVPVDWHVELIDPDSSPAGPCIERALAEPVGSPPLRELARGAERVCVVVEDPARPTRLGPILTAVMHELSRAGVPTGSVTVLVATGAHRWETDRIIFEKLGLPANRTNSPAVVIHSPQDCENTDIVLDKTAVRLNGHFLHADLRILIGSVIPHPFAAYSGGAKIVLPGIADLDSTTHIHKMAQLGVGITSDPDTNRFRGKIEAAVLRLGGLFCICCVPTMSGEVVGCWAGDLVAAHRAAVAVAARRSMRPLAEPADVLILNAYPKDVDLVQSRAALACLPRAVHSVIRPDGIVVLVTAAPFQARGHELFSPGGRLHGEPRLEQRLAGHELWLLTPAAEEEVRAVFGPGCRVFKTPGSLIEGLAGRLRNRARVAVLRSAPLLRLTSQRAAATGNERRAG